MHASEARGFPVHESEVRGYLVHESEIRGCPVHASEARGCPVHVSEVRGCPVHASEIRGAYTFLFQATTVIQQERKQGKGTGQTKSPTPQFVSYPQLCIEQRASAIHSIRAKYAW